MSGGREDRGSFIAPVIVGGLFVVCCAGPVLLTAGVLSAVGAVLANPFVIGAGVLLAAGAVVWAVRRRRCRVPSAEDGGPASPREAPDA